jgi:hypothetical protein
MKACEKNKKSLSLLAIGDLRADEAVELRSHIQTCADCRDYFREISDLAGELKTAASATPAIEASPSFHRSLARRIESEARSGSWAEVFSLPPLRGWNWRLIAPTAVATAVLATLLLVPRQSRQSVTIDAPAIATHSGITPSLATYHALANTSWDALDRELTREAAAVPTGPPIYAASSTARAMAAD